MVQLFVIVSALLSLIFGGTGAIAPQKPYLTHELTLGAAGFILSYALLQLFIVPHTISQIGVVIIGEFNRCYAPILSRPGMPNPPGAARSEDLHDPQQGLGQ